jgi:PIN domain nuclease of toxin-antitoxin system
VKVLLDTHVLLWVLTDSSKLSPTAATAYRNPGHELYISAASLWEIGIKVSLGKLILQNDWPPIIGNELERNGIRWLPIEMAHCATVATLPFHHRDPFDRLLVAQALHEGMTLLSADATLAAYGVEVLW